MKNSKISRLFGRGAREVSSAESSGDMILTSAQRYFAGEFPNPRRIECPQPEELSLLIKNEQLPGSSLRRHLLECSECFRDFQESLQAQREAHQMFASPPSTRLGSSFAWAKPLAIASAMLLLLLSAIVFITWLRGGAGLHKYQALTPAPVPTESAAPSVPSEPSQPPPIGSRKTGIDPLKKKPGSKPSSVLIAANHVDIDLQTATRSRGATHLGERDTLLSTGHNKIAIRLPPGSPVGGYQITLGDPFGNPIASSRVRSKDGIILLANLNLTSVKPGRYLFCVTREAEVPDCVPARVGPPQ
ncbi:MAG: hypothetical protein ACR2HX_05635 [Pyrinomonadaceae bacterium]